jgi:hypothetical protein
MRFALIATVAAAAVAVPLAVAAGAPQMSGDQFLNEVRCTAYENASGAYVAEAKYQLNAEARRQPAETAAQAQAEASDIARQVARSAPAAVGGEFAAACSRELASGVGSQAGA